MCRQLQSYWWKKRTAQFSSEIVKWIERCWVKVAPDLVFFTAQYMYMSWHLLRRELFHDFLPNTCSMRPDVCFRFCPSSGYDSSVNVVCQLILSYTCLKDKPVADLRRAPGTSPPLATISSFSCSFQEKLGNSRLAHPPLGNPGSATANRGWNVADNAAGCIDIDKLPCGNAKSPQWHSLFKSLN